MSGINWSKVVKHSRTMLQLFVVVIIFFCVSVTGAYARIREEQALVVLFGSAGIVVFVLVLACVIHLKRPLMLTADKAQNLLDRCQVERNDLGKRVNLAIGLLDRERRKSKKKVAVPLNPREYRDRINAVRRILRG